MRKDIQWSYTMTVSRDLRVAHWDGSFSGEVVDVGADYDNGVEVVEADTGEFASIQIV